MFSEKYLLQKVETAEREEEKASFKKTEKSAKGRAQKKKFTVNETEPSPHGRRVEPKIDPALRAKAEAAVRAAQRKKEKKENSDLFDDVDDEDSKMGLADRIGGKLGLKRDDPSEYSLILYFEEILRSGSIMGVDSWKRTAGLSFSMCENILSINLGSK